MLCWENHKPLESTQTIDCTHTEEEMMTRMVMQSCHPNQIVATHPLNLAGPLASLGNDQKRRQRRYGQSLATFFSGFLAWRFLACQFQAWAYVARAGYYKKQSSLN